jgi:ketosteroid isomerase-like protein
MSVEVTRAAVRDILDAFSRGDSERLAQRYDDDVDWLFYAPVSVFPFAGPRRGKKAAFQAIAEIYKAYKIERYEVEAVIADVDRASALADVTLVQRSTGRTVRSRVANFYRFRDGRVIEYRGFIDSFDAVEQALGRWIEVELPPGPAA